MHKINAINNNVVCILRKVIVRCNGDVMDNVPVLNQRLRHLD